MNQQLLSIINDNYSLVKKFIRRQLDSRLTRRVSESDVFQETCLEAKKSPKKNMSFGFFLKLLKRVTQRTNQRHLNSKDGSLLHENNASQIDATLLDSNPAKTEQTDTINRIELMIRQMSKKHQEILTLVHFRKMSIVQAANYLGITFEAGKKRYQRAISRLRELTDHLRN